MSSDRSSESSEAKATPEVPAAYWGPFFREMAGQEITIFLKLEWTAGATMTEVTPGPDIPPTQIERRATIDGKIEDSRFPGLAAIRQTITVEMSQLVGAPPGSLVSFIPFEAISHVGIQSALSVAE